MRSRLALVVLAGLAAAAPARADRAEDVDQGNAKQVVVVNATPRLGDLGIVARLRKVLDARGLLYKLDDSLEATLDGRSALISDLDQIKDSYADGDFASAGKLIEADEHRILDRAVGGDLAAALAELAQWRGIIAAARNDREEAMRQFRAAYRLDPASTVDRKLATPRVREMLRDARHELDETGRLEVEPDPDDARVAIDGGEARPVADRVELPIGIHLVVVSAKGRAPYAELVTIRHDQPYRMPIKLDAENDVVRAARLVDETAAAPAGKPRLKRAKALARLTGDAKMLVVEEGGDDHITLRLYDVELRKVSNKIVVDGDTSSATIARKIRAALDPDNLIDANAIIVATPGRAEPMHWYQHWYVWVGAAAVLGGGFATYEYMNRAPTSIRGF